VKPDYSKQVKRVQESIGILKLGDEIIEEEKKKRRKRPNRIGHHVSSRFATGNAT
jgi:hypothetical protein